MNPIEIAAQRTSGLDDEKWRTEKAVAAVFRSRTFQAVRALEDAGYKIVGPEPTEKMKKATPHQLWPADFWSAMYHAAPRWSKAGTGGPEGQEVEDATDDFGERFFCDVFNNPPPGVETKRMTTSPVGPFETIMAPGLVVYRREHRQSNHRMDYRVGTEADLRALAKAGTGALGHEGQDSS